MYGPFQDYNRFIPIIIKSCFNNSSFPCSHGGQLRDFTYVSDVVDAIIKTLNKKKVMEKLLT